MEHFVVLRRGWIGDIARFLSIVSLGKLGTNINMRMRRNCLNQSPRALTEKCERNRPRSLDFISV
jgi:hypothetical protein